MTSAPVRSGIKEGKPDADTSGRRPLNKRLSADYQSVKMVDRKNKKGTNAFTYGTPVKRKFFSQMEFSRPHLRPHKCEN